MNKTEKFSNCVAREIPWMPQELLEAFDQIVQRKVVVPSLETDQQFHALCLCTRVYNRINSLMCEAFGFGFLHRPCCHGAADDNVKIEASALSEQEVLEYGNYFKLLVVQMSRLEGDESPFNQREMEVGYYPESVYFKNRSTGSIVLN